MIRGHRIAVTAQDDASLIAGWNVAPNVFYALHLLPGAVSCGVLLYDETGVLVASGAALVGTDQPCVLLPQTGQVVDMVDTDLGWHLLLTTTGTESQRTIRLGPAVDLPDEIHPVYGNDDLALVRATEAIDAAAHYIDDITVSCPLGLGAGLGDIPSVPVDGASVVGQAESITWTATPDGTTEQAVIRRHVAIAPEAFAEPVPPTVADDAGVATHLTGTSGNVLTNDDDGLTVTAVNGLSGNVGVTVDGDNGGSFTININGSWAFDPGGDFDLLTGSETANTSVTYHASDGISEAMASLTVTISHANAAPVAVDDTGETTTNATTSGNVLTNDTDADSDSLAISQVAGSSANVGVAVTGSDGGLFTISSDGAWLFDPAADFDSLEEEQTATSSVEYQVSDGLGGYDNGLLTVTVRVAPAASIELVAEASANTTSAGGYSFTFSLPAETQPGDVVVIAGAFASAQAGPGASGWATAAAPYASDSYPVGMRVIYRVMPDPIPSNVTVNCPTTGVVITTKVFRGVDNSNPLDVSAVSSTGANSRNVTNPDLTTVTDGAVVIIAGAVGASGELPGMTPPTPYDGTIVSTQAKITVAMATTLASSAGLVSGGLWTGIGSSATSCWAATTLALRPA